MNRVILLLNVTVLVVNFLLALTATDSQIGLMRSASEIANYPRAPRRAALTAPGASLAYLRVVQSLEGIMPGDAAKPLTADKLRTIYDAVRAYQGAVNRGVARTLYEADEESDQRGVYQTLGKAVRQEVEHVLSAGFRDGTLVQRLATEVIKSCR
ncbi:MAG: hypothetical protein ACYS8L_10405 [Planctomycetota bacterium]